MHVLFYTLQFVSQLCTPFIHYPVSNHLDKLISHPLHIIMSLLYTFTVLYFRTKLAWQLLKAIMYEIVTITNICVRRLT